MTKVIILSEDTWIDDKLYRKGEIIPVPDDFNQNIKEVVNPDLDQDKEENVPTE